MTSWKEYTKVNRKQLPKKVVIEDVEEDSDKEKIKEIKTLFDKIFLVFMGYENIEEMNSVKGSMDWWEFYHQTDFKNQVKHIKKWNDEIEVLVNELEYCDIGYLWQSIYGVLSDYDGESLFVLWCTNYDFRDAVYDFHKIL